jgi:hypothetical protein
MSMGPVFLDWRAIIDLLLAMSVVGMLVGLIWLRRITGLDEVSGPSIFRDRDEGDPILADLREVALGLPPRISSRPLPSPIRRRLTARWFVTRFELATASLGTATVVLAWFVRPSTSLMSASPDWSTASALAGTLSCLVGLVCMIRIARRPAETGPTIWRSLQD